MKPDSHDLPRVARELMTDTVVTLTEDQNLEFIEESMSLFRFRHMPVVEEQKLIGLVTLRDILRVKASTLIPAATEQTAMLARKFTVADIMNRDVITMRPETPLIELAEEMKRHKLGCVPITTEANELVGIVTEADFLDLAARLLAQRT